MESKDSHVESKAIQEAPAEWSTRESGASATVHATRSADRSDRPSSSGASPLVQQFAAKQFVADIIAKLAWLRACDHPTYLQ
jgi:hypothetical protein